LWRFGYNVGGRSGGYKAYKGEPRSKKGKLP